MATNLPSCFFIQLFIKTPDVTSKLYFAEICKVSDKLWFLITKELIFGFQVVDLKDPLPVSLKNLFGGKGGGGGMLTHVLKDCSIRKT